MRKITILKAFDNLVALEYHELYKPMNQPKPTLLLRLKREQITELKMLALKANKGVARFIYESLVKEKKT